MKDLEHYKEMCKVMKRAFDDGKGEGAVLGRAVGNEQLELFGGETVNDLSKSEISPVVGLPFGSGSEHNKNLRGRMNMPIATDIEGLEKIWKTSGGTTSS